MTGQAKEKVKKKIDEQETLVKNQAAQEKELKETYERNLLVAQRGYQAAKKWSTQRWRSKGRISRKQRKKEKHK